MRRLKRRSVSMKQILAACLLAVMTTVTVMFAGETTAARPNVILFISDDHGWRDSGAYGDGFVRTPNIDLLAGQSVRFTSAFAASPLCVPSRCVIQTGLMPARNGAHAFGLGMKDTVRTMPDYFKALGYHTAHVGKWHHGNGKQPEYDFKAPEIETAAKVLAEHDKTKPLLLVACSKPPHLPWVKNKSYDVSKVEIPDNFVDTQVTRESRCDYYCEPCAREAVQHAHFRVPSDQPLVRSLLGFMA